MTRRQNSPRTEQTPDFRNHAIAIEIEPALAGGDDVEFTIRQPGFFRASDDKPDVEASGPRRAARLVNLLSREINPGDGSSLARKIQGEKTNPCADIEDPLPGQPDSQGQEPRVELIRIIRTPLGIVNRRLSPVNRPGAIVWREAVHRGTTAV